MKVLLIIPAYNEAANIEKVIESLCRYPYDYIIVNDGSKDKTAEICRKNGYRLIDLPVNLGLAGAVQTGMRYAYNQGYDYAVQFDGDGQHLPEYVAPMLKKAGEGYDIVIASRYATVKKPFSPRMIGSRVISAALFLTTGRHISDPTSGMRLYSRRLIKTLSENINFGPEPDTLAYLIRNRVSVAEVQAEMRERAAGKSYMSFYISFKYIVRMMLSIMMIQFIRPRLKIQNVSEKEE